MKLEIASSRTQISSAVGMVVQGEGKVERCKPGAAQQQAESVASLCSGKGETLVAGWPGSLSRQEQDNFRSPVLDHYTL